MKQNFFQKYIIPWLKPSSTANEKFRLLSIPYILILGFLVLVPVFLIFLYAITIPNREDAILFTFANFINFFQEQGFLTVLWDSVRISLITTLITLLIAYPTAYYISFYKLKAQALLILALSIPMWMNMLLRTIAWKQILSDGGPINIILRWVGLGTLDLVGTEFAVILGMIYIFLPFMVIPIYNSIAKIDESLYDAAFDLGASDFQTFFRVTFPLSIPGILSGITLVLLPSATTLVVPRYLGEGRYFLIGNLIESKFLKTGQWNSGAAISIVLVLVLLVILFATKRLENLNAQDREVE
jgi:spermidine/putrescine transport system permease protein